jgi:pimeloyl-ACP methyl ester carboxylesterase
MTRLPDPSRIELPACAGSRGTPLDAITLSVHEAGPVDGPAVVLCHGFPELAFSWRHQVAALAEAGFRVIAPDMRGYGESDCPESIESYSLEQLTADLARVLDALGIEKAVFAGHDWGGFVVWAMPIAYPDRTLGVIGVNTPNVPLPKTSLMRMAFPDDEKFYVLWFQQPGVAEEVMDGQARLCFEKLMRANFKPESGSMAERAASSDSEAGANPFRRLDQMPTIGEAILGAEELDFYVRAFEKTGFRGGINWYRNIDRNADAFPEIGVQKLDLPCLMVTAEWDMALPPSAAAGMPALCSDLETKMIERCGHWTQQDKPAELNAIMTDWLKTRFA